MGSTERTKLVIEVDSKGVVTANKELVKLTKTGKTTQAATHKMETGWDKFSGILKKTAGPLVLGAVITSATKMALEFGKAASEAEEIGSKYATVFASMGDNAETMANSFASSFGLATSTAKEMLGATGDILTGFGVSTSAAADLSVQTNTLASDLASFTNAAGGAKAVSNALISAYSGQTRALRTYGIVITQAAMEAEILKQKQAGVVYESEQQAKIYATLAIATEQSKNAVGDMARTWNSTANVSKRLTESTKALKEELGVTVNQGMTPFKIVLDGIVSGLADWIKLQNEIKTAKKDVDSGNASYSQQLLLLKKNLSAQEGLLASYEAQNKTAKLAKGYVQEVGQASIDAAEAQIKGINAQIVRYEALQKIKEDDAETDRKSKEAADLKEKKQEALDTAAEKFRVDQQSANEKAREAIQKEINKWWEYRGVLEGATELTDKLVSERKRLNEEIAKEKAGDPIIANATLAGLREAAELYGKNTDELLQYRMEKEKAANAEIKEALIISHKLELLNIAKQVQKNQTDLMKEGAQITKQYADAEAEHAAEVDHLTFLYNRGAIDAQTYNDALNDIDTTGKHLKTTMKDLGAQLASVAGSAGLDALKEIGSSLASGTKNADNFNQVMLNMVNNIIQQLPMMLLSAGLQMMAINWEVGLGLIAASGLVALGAGYLDTSNSSSSTANAHGNIYGDGNVIPFSSGSAFSNQIVSKPTMFPMANGDIGLMGEAGEEAIMPLTRTSNGDLGVRSAGGGGSNVVVNVINNSKEKATVTENRDNSGKVIYNVVIGAIKQGMSSGLLDGDFNSNYGVRRQGVAG